MTWEPTNELRWLQKPITRMVSLDTGVEMVIPADAPRLQQKWCKAKYVLVDMPDGGHEVGMEPTDQFEWRDVPLSVEGET